jgi:nucleoside-diphosphate-sugar epimerase
MPPTRSVLVTGVSGNLGARLLPYLNEFRVVGVDMRPPQDVSVAQFEQMDLGREASCRQLIDLLRATAVQSVVHLAFVLDPQQSGILDVERMWQINVAGTARVMEAISVVNRTGGNIRQFIYPSSVAAYGPETGGPVKEDAPLRAVSLPYAIHKRESDEVVRYRAESLGPCRIYMLRPHIFSGATVQNYMIGALRGTPSGRSKRAARLRAEGKRLPLMLPRDPKYLEKRFQFVHVDDMARLLTFLLYRPDSDPMMTIMNVAGRGDSLTVARCAEIAQATIKRTPTKAWFRTTLNWAWKLGLSSIPPEALPYLIGSYTMDTTRLQQFLGADYPRVIQYTVEDALKDSFSAAADGQGLEVRD